MTRIGIIGAGYMGKLHAVAMHSVGAVFNTSLRPVCEMLCATTDAGAADKARALGFKRSTSDWRTLVNDPAVDAIVVASPQSTHKDIALEAITRGKPVLCGKTYGCKHCGKSCDDRGRRSCRYRQYGWLQLCACIGYQDQMIIEARDFVKAIHKGCARWPTFRDGHQVNQVIEAIWTSHESKSWVNV